VGRSGHIVIDDMSGSFNVEVVREESRLSIHRESKVSPYKPERQPEERTKRQYGLHAL